MAITSKDLRITLSGPAPLIQALLLGLLLIFIFSLSKGPGETASPQEAAAIFWLASAFSQILIFNQLYALEEINACNECLAIAPAPVQGIWLGKAISGLILLCANQIVFLPGLVVFLGQNAHGPIGPGFSGTVIANIGMASLGSLLGALAQGETGKESLLSVIILPLMLPLLLAAISLGSISLGGIASQAPSQWLGIGMAFDAIFVAAGLVLSGFIFRSEN